MKKQHIPGVYPCSSSNLTTSKRGEQGRAVSMHMANVPLSEWMDVKQVDCAVGSG